jgi:prolipoprotein diacylglyceryltransferase
MAPAIRFMAAGSQIVVSTHGLFVVLAVIVGTLLAVRRAREPVLVVGVAPFATVAALAGSHLLFRVEHGGPAGLWSGGLASSGGIAGVMLVVGSRTKRVFALRLSNPVCPGVYPPAAVP